MKSKDRGKQYKMYVATLVKDREFLFIRFFKNDYEKLSLYHDLDKIDNKNDLLNYAKLKPLYEVYYKLLKEMGYVKWQDLIL